MLPDYGWITLLNNSGSWFIVRVYEIAILEALFSISFTVLYRGRTLVSRVRIVACLQSNQFQIIGNYEIGNPSDILNQIFIWDHDTLFQILGLELKNIFCVVEKIITVSKNTNRVLLAPQI